MAEAISGGGAPSRASAFILGIFMIIYHIVDLLYLRRSNLVSIQMLSISLTMYLIFAIWAKGVMREQNWRFVGWFIAMWAVPIVLGLFAKYVQNESILKVATMSVVFFPLFIFYFLSRGVCTLPITLYFTFWMVGIMFWFGQDIQTYAKEQNIELGFNPMLTWEYLTDWSVKSVKNMFTAAGVKYTIAQSEITNAIKAAQGDYYSGQVDADAKRRLGVYIENLKPSERIFYDNTPVTAYTTMSAQTLDKSLDITVACDADGGAISASNIRPQSSFNIISSDQYDIDCIWSKGLLKKGSHTLRLIAEFEFTTRAYMKSYMMDKDRLREYRRQNIDPLAGVPDKIPVATYTSGPVRIGMSLGQQPIPLGRSGEPLQSWGVTIDNLWDGKLVELTNVLFFVPKGIKITNIEGVQTKEVRCIDIPEEERESCDDNLVNIYALTPDELALPVYKNLVTKSFRIPLEINDPEKALGKAPLSVKNFKVTAQYRYLLERTAPIAVSEVQMTA